MINKSQEPLPLSPSPPSLPQILSSIMESQWPRHVALTGSHHGKHNLSVPYCPLLCLSLKLTDRRAWRATPTLVTALGHELLHFDVLPMLLHLSLLVDLINGLGTLVPSAWHPIVLWEQEARCTVITSGKVRRDSVRTVGCGVKGSRLAVGRRHIPVANPTHPAA